MKILSDPNRDFRSADKPPGGYEWWYFDAVSTDGMYSFVIIFYEGNPFSTRYIKALGQKEGVLPGPSEYPAVSISIYKQGNPIYYSFTEFSVTDCTFSGERPFVKAGPHRMESTRAEGRLLYVLRLDETLPSGDWLRAEIEFESHLSLALSLGECEKISAGHCWNLVQPRAEVSGSIRTGTAGIGARDRTIAFRGRGYHDHNSGEEPMDNEFANWYWGRFHFDYATLIYYVMNGKNKQQRQQQAWLIDTAGRKMVDKFDHIDISDKSLSIFGLHSARMLNFQAEGAEVHVQQSQKLDNGPFYQRFRSEGFLRLTQSGVVESVRGITEYLCPGRIRMRLFWPLVNMRIRQAHEKPHWVQRSGRLYRWTW